LGVARGLLALLAVALFVLPLSAIPVLGDEDSGDEVLTIAAGKSAYWTIGGIGDIHFKVEVVAGGPVDVLITKNKPDTSELRHYEGYRYLGVTSVDEIFDREKEDEVYLVVDNSDDVGAHTQGDARVHVEWELVGEFAAMLLRIVGPIVAIFVALAIAIVLYKRWRSVEEDPEWMELEEVYVDARGRPIPPPTTSVLEQKEAWCPRCGTQMRIDPLRGKYTCPKCGARPKRRAPPPPPPSTPSRP
jgi:hypothetical protein